MVSPLCRGSGKGHEVGGSVSLFSVCEIRRDVVFCYYLFTEIVGVFCHKTGSRCLESS